MTQSPLALIKIGGDILLSDRQKQGLVANIKTLRESGWQILILHGGGPQVNQLQKQLGITPNKVAGRRITSEQDLQQVIQAIAGEVNVALCSLLLAEKLPVLGTHGASNLIKASKRPPIAVSGIDGRVDFGAVGDVSCINVELIKKLLHLDLIPVIATLAHDEKGNCYNINADTTAVALAVALKVDLLLMNTAVGGIYEDIKRPQSLIKTINSEKAEKLIQQGIITDGMIPKVQEALSIVSDGGVGQVVITSLDNPNNLNRLLEKADQYDLGTRILAE